MDERWLLGTRWGLFTPHFARHQPCLGVARQSNLAEAGRLRSRAVVNNAPKRADNCPLGCSAITTMGGIIEINQLVKHVYKDALTKII